MLSERIREWNSALPNTYSEIVVWVDEVALLEQRIEELAWAVQMVLRDFEDNDSPCLSVAAVNAVQKVAPLAQQEEIDA